MLPLSGACTPKIVIDIMQRPMISDISASLSCPNPAPPSFGSRNAPHSPRAFTWSWRWRLHRRATRRAGSSSRIGSSGISSRVDELAHPRELLLELGIGLEVPSHRCVPGSEAVAGGSPRRLSRCDYSVISVAMRDA